MKIYRYEDKRAKETRYYFPDVPYREAQHHDLISAIASLNNEVIEVDDWGRIATLIREAEKTGYLFQGTILVIKAARRKK